MVRVVLARIQSGSRSAPARNKRGTEKEMVRTSIGNCSADTEVIIRAGFRFSGASSKSIGQAIEARYNHHNSKSVNIRLIN